MMMTQERIKFDRHNPEPPVYLLRLRNKGWWRMLDYLDHLEGRFSRGYNSHYYRTPALQNLPYEVEGGVYIDAGCGESPDALIAAHSGFDRCIKFDLYPIDLHPANIHVQHFRDEEAKKQIEFIRQDICERFPLPDNSVDAITCNAMIELIPEEERQLFYKEAKRVLKPGGLLSISVVHLVNGWYTDSFFERDVCTMPGWGINFQLDHNFPGGFVVYKEF